MSSTQPHVSDSHVSDSHVSDSHVAAPCQGRIAQLVLRCGQGDEAALGELFDLTFFLVAACVKREAASAEGADDEVVEAFWRIWRRSASYQPRRQEVLSWVLDQALDDRARSWSITPAGRRP
jgi:hypothetical protein